MLRSLLSGLVGALLIGACTLEVPSPPVVGASPSPVVGGNLRFGVIGEPATLDPFSPRATYLTFQLATPRLERPLSLEVRPGGSVVATGRRAANRLDEGPFELARYERGLKLVLEPNEAGESYLDRITMFFIDSVEIALQLLKMGRLDAAALPSSVNLDERLEELGLEHAEELGYEAVHMHFNRRLLSGPEFIAIARRIDRKALLEGFVRGDGRSLNRLFPTPEVWDGGWAHVAVPGGDPPDAFKLAIPAGDELLALMQRAIQLQLAERGIQVELITVPAATLYAGWIGEGPAEAVLARTIGGPGLNDPSRYERAFSRAYVMPIAHVETVLAWREGVYGLDVEPTLRGPFWNAEGWWKDAEL
ncbi:MAG: ABC transporter substrate-binding protein [Actinomycetota bacterium]|nr:ABC transporter substrate-binding protein [Actinomycetota bacterium]